MSLEAVEKAIANLDAGPFQNLSRAFLKKKLIDYSCQANGSMIGSVKTTKSHPDCLFINKHNNRFIMEECTTQQTSLGKKLKSDISGCLDESQTKIPVQNIEKIIFCYSNGKIPNDDIFEQKEYLLSLGVKLELISVNDMALDIEDKYPELAMEFLNINLYKSLNILSVDEFINDSNNGLSPSLDKVFSSRDREIEDLKHAFLDNDIIILYGKSGVGKSKLAIELLKSIEPDENKIKCIKARGLFDYTDILRTTSYTEYYLIDDADKFSDIKTIISYLKNKKIVFTIRNYELAEFLLKLDNLEVNFFKYELDLLSEEAVNNVIKNNIGSCSESFLIKLNELVQGNIRLAFMIAETCKNNNNISFLYDPKDIFGKYYENRINKLLSIEKANLLLRCIALITFVKQVDLNELDLYSDLLIFLNIEKNKFKEIIRYLEREEIVSIFENEIVEMNDQCLSNYLKYYVFFHKKTVRLRDIFINLFSKYKRNIISMINKTLNVFLNKDDFSFIKDDLKEAWESFKDNKIVLKELASAFSSLNSEGSLKLLNDTIKENKVDEEWVINSFNSVLNIETKFAVKLFKTYILNGLISIQKAELILIDNYQFDEHDWLRNYMIQDIIVSELSIDFPIFVNSLSNYCLKLLQFEYGKISMHDNKAVFARMNIGNGDENLYLLRKKCIIFLIQNNSITKIFKTYFTYCPQDNNIELFKRDITSFNNEIENIKKDERTETCIYFYSKHIFDYYKLKWDYLYLRNKSMIDFLEPIFNEPVDRSITYEERKTKYEKILINDIALDTQLTIERVSELVLFDCTFDNVSDKIRNYFELCIAYIDKAYFDELILILINSKWLDSNINSVCGIVDRYKKISNIENSYRVIKDIIPDVCKPKAFEWLFITINDSDINESTIRLFDDYVGNINKYPFTNFVPQRWIKICQNIPKLLHLCKKALEFEKNGYGPYALYLIFEHDNRDSLFDNLFKENSDFIEELYLKALKSRDDYFDEKGVYLLKIIRNNINFLSVFIDEFLYYHHDLYSIKRIEALWNSDEYITYGDLLFTKLINVDKKYMIQFYATTIMGCFNHEGNKAISVNQLNWFNHSLSMYSNTQENIIYLFECVRDFDYASKAKCLELLFKYSNDFETFKKINLNPTMISFSVSEIPYIRDHISFYEKVKEIIPPDICFIDHLAYIDEILQYLKKSISRTLINEKKRSNKLNC